jgi:hypothetical protein
LAPTEVLEPLTVVTDPPLEVEEPPQQGSTGGPVGGGTTGTYDARQLRELERVGCFDFQYDLGAPRKLDDGYADVILVLRKVGGIF